MPNLPNYTSPLGVEGVRPSELGAEAWQQEGRRVGIAYHQIGQDVEGAINTLQAHDDLQTSIAMSQKAQQYNDNIEQYYQTHRNDPNFSLQDFQGYVQDTYANLDNVEEKGVFGSVLGHSDKIAAHSASLQEEAVSRWSARAAADQMQIAGDKAHATLVGITDDSARTAFEHPELYSSELARSEASGVPMLSMGTTEAEDVAGWKDYNRQTIAGKTLDGWVNKIAHGNGDPAMTMAIKEMVNNPDSALYKNATPEALDHFNKMADEAGRAAAVQYREVNKQDFDQKTSAFLAQYVQPDGSMRPPPDAGVTIKQLAQLPGATPGEIKSLGEMTESLIRVKERGGQLHSDPEVLHSLLGRIMLPPTDHNAITQAEVFDHMGKDLSMADGRFILSRLNSKVPQDRSERLIFNQTLAQAKTALVTTDMLGTKTGEDNYSAFLSWFLPTYDMARKTHTAVDLLTPGSPDYILGKGAEKLHQFGASDTGLAGMIAQVNNPLPGQPQQPSPAAKHKPIGEFMGALLGGAP